MTFVPRGGFRLGKMRDRVNVYNATTANDSAGQPIVTWQILYANEPVAFDPASGGVTSRGRQVESFINAIFTVHYRTTFTTTQSLIHNGTRYGIVYVKPVDGGTRFIELFCKAIPT